MAATQVHPAAAALLQALAGHAQQMAPPDVPLPGYPTRQGLDQPTIFGGGQAPAPAPQPEPAPEGEQTSDAEVLAHATASLSHYLQLTRDPQLRAHLATALAALHKHGAGMQKDHEAAMRGKPVPSVLAR